MSYASRLSATSSRIRSGIGSRGRRAALAHHSMVVSRSITSSSPEVTACSSLTPQATPATSGSE